MDKLDSFDISILKQIQQDASQTAVAIGEKICLSTSQCHRRIKRLEQAGLIEKYVALLNNKKFDLNISAIVMITVHKDTPQTKQHLIQFVQQNEDVQECWTVIGEKYAMLKVVSKNMETFSHFISKKLMSDSNIASSESLLMMENLKATTQIPID